MLSFFRSEEYERAGVAKLTAEIQLHHSRAVDYVARIAEKLQSVRDAEARWVAKTFSGEFARAAEEHALDSLGWLIGLVGLAIALPVILIYALDPPKALDAASLTAFALQRFVIISVFSTALYVATRSYRANSHLAATNRHRANVLMTFDLLIQTTKDESTRDALLKSAADSIFQSGSTGFLEGKDSRLDEQLVTLLRESVAKK